MPFRLLHSADLHLDAPVVGVGSTPAPVTSRLADAALDTLDRLADAAVDHEVDALVLAGGLTVGGAPSRRTCRRARATFEALADRGITVVAVASERDRFDLLFDGWSPPSGVVLGGTGPVRAHTVERRGEPVGRVLTGSGLAGFAALVGHGAPTDLPLAAVCPLPPLRPGAPPPPPLATSPVRYWALGGRAPAQAVPLAHGAWLVVPGSPQLHHFPAAGTGTAASFAELPAPGGGPPPPPNWVPVAAVELVTVVVPLGDLRRLDDLESHLSQLADGYCAALPGRLVVLRAVAEGTGPLRSELIDPFVRFDLVDRLRAASGDRWWSDAVLAPLPRDDALRLMTSTAAGADVARAASAARAGHPVDALAAAWAPTSRPIAGTPPPAGWAGLVMEATSLALDLTGGPS